MTYKIIYLYGLDGSGKSTLCQELVRLLRQEGGDIRYEWMRFNHYFAKLVNALGRALRLSYYVMHDDGSKIGYHEYYRSKVVSTLHVFVTIADTFVASCWKLWLPMLFARRTIILDRYVFDTMVDLCIDTRDHNLITNWQGRILKRFLHPSVIPIFVSVDKDVILNRRPSVVHDRNLHSRMLLYAKVAQNYSNGSVVDNNGNIESALSDILDVLRRCDEEEGSHTAFLARE